MTAFHVGCALSSSSNCSSETSEPSGLMVATDRNFKRVVGGLLRSHMSSDGDGGGMPSAALVSISTDQLIRTLACMAPKMAAFMSGDTGPWKQRIKLSLVDHLAATKGLTSKRATWTWEIMPLSHISIPFFSAVPEVPNRGAKGPSWGTVRCISWVLVPLKLGLSTMSFRDCFCCHVYGLAV